MTQKLIKTERLIYSSRFHLFLGALLTGGFAIALIVGLPVWFPFLILGAVISVVLLFEQPLWLLFGLIVVRMSLDYWSQYFSVTLFDVSLSLSQLLGVSIAALGILIIALYRRQLASFSLGVPFLIICLWGTMTLFYSLSPRSTAQELLRIFDLYALSFLAYVSVRETKDFRRLLLALFVSGILPTLFGLYQYINHIGLEDENVSIPRIFGTFSHPNVFSLYLFTLIVMGIMYLALFARSTRQRMIYLALTGMFTLLLLLAYARVAWLALLFFGFLIALMRFRMLLIPLLLFPLVLYTFSATFQERVQESLTPGPDSSIVWRLNLWHDVTRASIQDGRLLLGSGMDTFPKVAERLRGIQLGSTDPHNDVVKFFVEGGVLGVGVYLLYIGSILFLLVRGYLWSPNKSALRLSFGLLLLYFLSLQLASLSDNVFKNTPVQWIFFTVTGALLSLSYISRQKKTGLHSNG